MTDYDQQLKNRNSTLHVLALLSLCVLFVCTIRTMPSHRNPNEVVHGTFIVVIGIPGKMLVGAERRVYSISEKFLEESKKIKIFDPSTIIFSCGMYGTGDPLHGGFGTDEYLMAQLRDSKVRPCIDDPDFQVCMRKLNLSI